MSGKYFAFYKTFKLKIFGEFVFQLKTGHSELQFVIPTLKRQRQEDHHKSGASLGYQAYSKTPFQKTWCKTKNIML